MLKRELLKRNENFFVSSINLGGFKMVEKKQENNLDEKNLIKKKVTKVDPDDDETNIHR